MKTHRSTPIKVATSLVLGFLFIFLLHTVGEIEYRFEDASFTVHTSVWSDKTVAYEEIERIERRESFDAGQRTNGFGSSKLSAGRFRNREFGAYQLYAYSASEIVVVLHLQDGSILVLTGGDNAATEELYSRLENRACSVQ